MNNTNTIKAGLSFCTNAAYCVASDAKFLRRFFHGTMLKLPVHCFRQQKMVELKDFFLCLVNLRDLFCHIGMNSRVARRLNCDTIGKTKFRRRPYFYFFKITNVTTLEAMKMVTLHANRYNGHDGGGLLSQIGVVCVCAHS